MLRDSRLKPVSYTHLMGQGIAKAFAQVDGYEVALCDIKQEWADGGKAKIVKGLSLIHILSGIS